MKNGKENFKMKHGIGDIPNAYYALKGHEKTDLEYKTNSSILKVFNTLENKLKLFEGKKYAPEDSIDVSYLNELDINEVKRRIELATKLEGYGIKEIDFSDFRMRLSEIARTKDLEEKLDLLKGKSYAPEFAGAVETINNVDKDEVKRRIELATKLEGYGIKAVDFRDFRVELSEIARTKDLEEKLDLLKGKSYAPEFPHHVETINNVDKDEVKRRIELATKLEEYGIKAVDFRDFRVELSEIARTESLKNKLEKLKGRKDAPKYLHHLHHIM